MWNSLTKLHGQQASGMLFFHLLYAGITSIGHHAHHFMWVLPIKLRSSAYRATLFIPTEFLPTPDFILYFLSLLYFLFFNMETGLFYIGQPDLDLIREPRLASALSSCLCLLSTRITVTSLHSLLKCPGHPR